MPFTKEEQEAIWHAIDRASDDLANWKPMGPEEEEAHENGSNAVETAYLAMQREYPR